MVVLFWLLATMVFATAWLVSFGLWLTGRATRKPWLRYLGGIPLAGLTCYALLMVGLFAWAMLRTQNPSAMFEDTFGFAPPSDVSAVQSSVGGIGDNAYTHLKFKASPATIKRIVALGFKRVPASKLINGGFSYFQNGEEPAWWTPKMTKTAQYYTMESRGDLDAAFSTEDAILVYDPPTRTAYYAYIGVD